MVRIPIQNIWLLMLYASDFYQQMDQNMWASEDLAQDLPQTLIQFFVQNFNHYLRYQLSKNYVASSQRLNQVRGRIDLAATYHQQLLEKGQVQCHVQQLSVNTQRHQYLYTVLQQLQKHAQPMLQRQLQQLVRQLQQLGVQHMLTVAYQPQQDQFFRHEKAQQQLIYLANLLVKMQLPNQQVGQQHFLYTQTQGAWLNRLFEKAMAGFYKRHFAAKWQVRSGVNLRWSPSSEASSLYEYIPQMKTDFILKSRYHTQCIVVDAKFTNIVTSGYYQKKHIFNSQYLYQIYSYLRSQEYEQSPWQFTDAMLLHPSLGQHFQDHVTIQNYRIYYCTVDLNQNRQTIEQQLIAFIDQIAHPFDI